MPLTTPLNSFATRIGIDPSRIFLVGHSQGGGLAPRMARENPSLAGIVVLAGNTHSLQDAMLDQFTYMASLHPETTALAAKIDAVRKFKQVVEDPALRANQDVELPTGGSVKGAYSWTCEATTRHRLRRRFHAVCSFCKASATIK